MSLKAPRGFVSGQCMVCLMMLCRVERDGRDDLLRERVDGTLDGQIFFILLLHDQFTLVKMHLNMFLMALLGHGFVQAKLVANGPELDLVLRQMGDFDFDIISVEDQGDEDVFYFRRAAPVEQGKPKEDDCEKDDCAAFNAWSGEEMSQEDDKDEGDDGEDDNQNNAVGKRETTIASGGTSSSHTLSKRKPKPAKLCAKTLIDGKTTFEPQIQFQSHAYPAAGNKKIKDVSMISKYCTFTVTDVYPVSKSVRLCRIF
jgi:hypothetical protein